MVNRRVRPVGTASIAFGWPDPITGPWQCTFYFAELDGRHDCVGVDFRSFITKRGAEGEPTAHVVQDELAVVTTAAWRGFPVQRMIAEARTQLDEFIGLKAGLEDDPELAERIRAVSKGLRGRRARYGKEHFESVAHVYKTAYAASESPTQAVATVFHVSHSAAAKWVAKCRELHLLPPTSRGRAAARQD